MDRLIIKPLILILAVLIGLGGVHPVGAQESQREGPVYIVQEGDSLWNIAQRFGVSMDDLAQTNGISDINQV